MTQSKILPFFWAGGITASIIQLVLYARVTPFGVPFVIDFWHYFPYAVFYEWYGMALLLIPFFGLELLFRKFGLKKSEVILFVFYALSIIFFLSAGHANHELQRFMGTRLSPTYLATYAKINGTPEAIVDAIADDSGGAYSSLYFFLLPFLVFPVALTVKKIKVNTKSLIFLWIFGVVIFFLLPLLSSTVIPGGFLRQDKVAPGIIALYKEFLKEGISPKKIKDLSKEIVFFQKNWAESDTSGRFVFEDKLFPLKKRCITPYNIRKKPNFIVVVLETFRAKNMNLYNKNQKEISTPFLDTSTIDPSPIFI